VAKAQLKDERSYLTETANSKAVVMEKISNTQDKIADSLAAKNVFLSAKNRFHEMKSLRENYQFYKEIGDTVTAWAELRKIQQAPPPPPQPSTPEGASKNVNEEEDGTPAASSNVPSEIGESPEQGNESPIVLNEEEEEEKVEAELCICCPLRRI
jgi:hypothetical protein